MVSQMCNSSSLWTIQDKGQAYIYGNNIITKLDVYDATLNVIGEINVQC